jgi:hypothetical protein
MSHYEVRLRRKGLSQFLDEIARAAWDELTHMVDLSPASAERARRGVRAAIRRYVVAHLRRYEECGSQLSCGVESITSRPLVAERELPDERVDPNLREDATIYILHVEYDLGTFVETLVSMAWWALVESGVEVTRRLTIDERIDLTAALARAFGPHLYRNDECGKGWTCQHHHEIDLF